MKFLKHPTDTSPRAWLLDEKQKKVRLPEDMAQGADNPEIKLNWSAIRNISLEPGPVKLAY